MADPTPAPAGLDVRTAIARVSAGEHLGEDDIASVFGQIMDGGATPAQIGALLVALKMKGETPEELAGAARAMRARATPLAHPDPDRGVDTCGTGGDGAGTLNVSTLAAIIVAAAGGVVAKHGNRALSSRSGSADVLETLGVKIDATPPVVQRCMAEVGIGFAFAPAFHAATKHAAGPRKELGVRTLFNLLGPMTNPAQVRHQVIGVFDQRWCEPVATALGRLGATRVYVVHGAGGLDEVAVDGRTFVAEWNAATGAVRTYEVDPGTFGFEDADRAGLLGGDAAHNAAELRRVLAIDGIAEGGPRRAVFTAAAMEAAMALVAIGASPDFHDAAGMAGYAVHSGAAQKLLAAWTKLSQEPAPP
jgi:anthranilate phosphoribosyltransferase